MLGKLFSRMFIRKLRKSSPKEVAALLGTVNLDQRLIGKIIEKIKGAGFHVLKEEEVDEKKLNVKSRLNERSLRQQTQ